jgi:hypothetical protein
MISAQDFLDTTEMVGRSAAELERSQLFPRRCWLAVQ